MNTRMREVCNLGYGRHGCEQFPAASAADAIRFHVVKDSGELIQIQYVFEKECWPREHGDAPRASPTKSRSARPTFSSKAI